MGTVTPAWDTFTRSMDRLDRVTRVGRLLDRTARIVRSIMPRRKKGTAIARSRERRAARPRTRRVGRRGGTRGPPSADHEHGVTA